MSSAPRRLSADERKIIESTIREVCEFRRWSLHAVNCRTNHVHAVVFAADTSPERVMNQLKSWCSRRLKAATVQHDDGPCWTRHGSTRYLWTEDVVEAAVDYVLNGQ